MKCPICYYEDTKVLDSRSSMGGFRIKRRRECLKCGFRFSTFEEVEILGLYVIKNNGEKEMYNRKKLVKGLETATKKRTETKKKIKNLVHLIERDVQKKRFNEIRSSELGGIVMKHLKKVDKIAYIRFASVYKSFDDMQTFRDELNKL